MANQINTAQVISGIPRRRWDNVKQFKKFISEFNFNFHQIFNANELELYGKCIATGTMAFVSEWRAPGHKSGEGRVTILVKGNIILSLKVLE